MTNILLIGLAGMGGALSRYWLTGLVHKLMGSSFPWGTLAANIAGCFFFGVIFALAEERFMLRDQTRIILLAGFMGSFTTFSSLIFECSQLLRDAQWVLAGLNYLGQTVLGLMALWLGIVLIRAMG
jgi:CrcB protein